MCSFGRWGAAPERYTYSGDQTDCPEMDVPQLARVGGLAGAGAPIRCRRVLTQRAIVVQLNSLGIKAPRGGVWSLGQVQRVVNASGGP
jgi:hypothetical protein